MLKDYIKIARPDHWIKQMFIVPGALFAFLLAENGGIDGTVIRSFIFSFISTCLVASANYVINEWLDADFDKYHPTKKYRPVVSDDLKTQVILAEYAVLGAAGLVFGYMTSIPVFLMELWLFVMGIVYNVRPLRTKEIPYLDVLSESVNNAIRLLIGWFAVTTAFYPPVSIVLGYWMSGAFLMAVKRYSEYRMIGDKETAGLYRRSFKYYSEQSLLISAFFYALMAVFFCGIFLIKYKIELIFAIPLLSGLFCYYLHLSYKKDSSVQKPEKLYKEKGLMIYILILGIVFVLLMFMHIDGLMMFLDKDLIPVK